MAMELKTSNGNYKVKFGFNSFCDTDLMDRTSDLINLFRNKKVENDADVSNIGKLKEMFCCVRELLFVGFQKHNPVGTIQEVGEIIDNYHDEQIEGESKGIIDLFTKIAEELFQEGYLGELMGAESEQENKPESLDTELEKKK